MGNLLHTCAAPPATTLLLLAVLGLWTLLAVLCALWRLLARRKPRLLRPADVLTVRIRAPRSPQAVRREVRHG